MTAAFSGSVQTASLAFVPGEISVECNALFDPTLIRVQTYDASGVAADRTFQFMESCA